MPISNVKDHCNYLAEINIHNVYEGHTSAANRMIPNTEARQITIESVGFENANTQCKWIIRPLKTR